MSFAEKHKAALFLLGDTGHVDALDDKAIPFQRGFNKKSVSGVTSDILGEKVKEFFEAYEDMTKIEKTALFNRLIDELIKLGKVFVIFHKGLYYGLDMSIDEVRNEVRSKKVAQLFRDRTAVFKKYISAFVELGKYLQREIAYVNNLDVDEETNKIYENFLKIVKTKDETRKKEKIQNFHESYKKKPAVFDVMLTLCTDNHFVNLPAKIRVANHMQDQSNESMDEDEDDDDDDDDDDRNENIFFPSNDEIDDCFQFLDTLFEGEVDRSITSDMDYEVLTRIIVNDNASNENALAVDVEVNDGVQGDIVGDADDSMDWLDISKL